MVQVLVINGNNITVKNIRIHFQCKMSIFVGRICEAAAAAIKI
jgi:hypothetical protein